MSQTLEILDLALFKLGDKSVTLGSVLLFIVAILFLFAFAQRLSNWLVNRLLARTHLDVSTRQTVGTLVRYAILVLGFMAVMQTLGINLTSFSVLAGALGVGIGFGLQNIFSNFISGLIVMFERPVKIGDRIEIGGFEGDVLQINARTTTLRSNRGATVIVPNQKFVTEFVRNWDVGLHGGNTTSLVVPLKVAHGHDPGEVQRLLTANAGEQEGILDEPPPTVFLTAVDAAGYAFELQVWVRGDPVERSRVMTQLLGRLYAALAESDVKLV